MFDLAPHAIDLLDAALGPVTDVTAVGDPLRWLGLTLEHRGGAVSQVALSITAPGDPAPFWIEARTQDGPVTFDGARSDDDAGVQESITTALAQAVSSGIAHPLDVHRGRVPAALDDEGPGRPARPSPGRIVPRWSPASRRSRDQSRPTCGSRRSTSSTAGLPRAGCSTRNASAGPSASSTPTCSDCRRSTATSHVRATRTSPPLPPTPWGPATTVSSQPCPAGRTAGHRQPGRSRPTRPAYGVAFLSRYDVLGWRVVRLPAAPVQVPHRAEGHLVPGWVRDEPRVAVVAEVDTPRGRIDVVTTHLSFLWPWNGRQLRRLMAHLTPRPHPLMLIGDLNMGPRRAHRITGMEALATGATFPSRAPRVQIDHVLSTGGLVPLPCPCGRTASLRPSRARRGPVRGAARSDRVSSGAIPTRDRSQRRPEPPHARAALSHGQNRCAPRSPAPEMRRAPGRDCGGGHFAPQGGSGWLLWGVEKPLTRVWRICCPFGGNSGTDLARIPQFHESLPTGPVPAGYLGGAGGAPLRSGSGSATSVTARRGAGSRRRSRIP